MKIILIVLLVSPSFVYAEARPKVIHVFVTLCDNACQGIVPVPPKIGNGDDPQNNLYWGAAYGVKTYFKKSADWQLISTTNPDSRAVLERCIFKHRTKNIYLVADAYRGRKIKKALVDFLNAASGSDHDTVTIETNNKKLVLKIGGASELVAYVGHNGLMDFQISEAPQKKGATSRDAIVLACISKSYFAPLLRQAGANPLVWTTGLMAPEAYTLKSAIDGWAAGENEEQIILRAADAYNRYQKCGMNALSQGGKPIIQNVADGGD